MVQWLNARFACGRQGLDAPSNHTEDLVMVYAVSLPKLSILGKRMGVKHTVVPNGQPRLLHSLCLHSWVVQRLMKRRWMLSCSSKMAREGTLTLTFDCCVCTTNNEA